MAVVGANIIWKKPLGLFKSTPTTVLLYHVLESNGAIPFVSLVFYELLNQNEVSKEYCIKTRGTL